MLLADLVLHILKVYNSDNIKLIPQVWQPNKNATLKCCLPQLLATPTLKLVLICLVKSENLCIISFQFWADLVHFRFTNCSISTSVTTDVYAEA